MRESALQCLDQARPLAHSSDVSQHGLLVGGTPRSFERFITLEVDSAYTAVSFNLAQRGQATPYHLCKLLDIGSNEAILGKNRCHVSTSLMPCACHPLQL